MKKTNIETVVCNVCNSSKATTILYKKPYAIVQCNVCGLLYLSPRPTKKDTQKLYTDDYFESECGIGYTNYSCLQPDLHKEANQRLQLIRKYIRNGKLLDVGCGYGDFLVEAQKNGFNVMGCDISSAAVSFIKKNYHISAQIASIEKGQLPKRSFDVITAWDVIEHMVNPLASLQELYRVQSNNGYLFMTTPSVASIDARLLGRSWYGYKRIPEHLYYFSPQTITILLQKVGYTEVQVKSWGFQRNLAYCIDQVGKYNAFIGYLLSPLSKILLLHKLSLFFPFIDMIVIAHKYTK